MKKYILIAAEALANGYLLIEGDEIYAQLSHSGTLYYVYSPKTRKRLGYTTKEKFEAIIKEKQPDFVNGFVSWIETYTEMFSYILQHRDSNPNSVVVKTQLSEGFPALVTLATNWANEFEEKNKGREWDGEFWEEAYKFAHLKDTGTLPDVTPLYMSTSKLGEVLLSLSSLDEDGEQFDITESQKDLLVDNDLAMYNLEHGWHYFPENYEKVKLILNPKPFQDL